MRPGQLCCSRPTHLCCHFWSGSTISGSGIDPPTALEKSGPLGANAAASSAASQALCTGWSLGLPAAQREELSEQTASLHVHAFSLPPSGHLPLILFSALSLLRTGALGLGGVFGEHSRGSPDHKVKGPSCDFTVRKGAGLAAWSQKVALQRRSSCGSHQIPAAIHKYWMAEMEGEGSHGAPMGTAYAGSPPVSTGLVSQDQINQMMRVALQEIQK